MKINHTVSIVVEASALLGSIAVLSATLTVIFMAAKRKTWKDLPIKIRIALILYSLHAPGACTYYAVGLARDNWEKQLHTKATRIVNSVGVILWLCLHWQFAAYYLQTACLFRITFR